MTAVKVAAMLFHHSLVVRWALIRMSVPPRRLMPGALRAELLSVTLPALLPAIASAARVGLPGIAQLPSGLC